ncbi:MAG: hypothetical protein JNG89_11730 [Planctomycetaceae bacterium]|nr:hypothetical protein [Planctomycetaceae bacterium]
MPRCHTFCFVAAVVCFAAAPTRGEGLFDSRLARIVSMSEPDVEQTSAESRAVEFATAVGNSGQAALCSCGIGGGFGDRLLGFISPSDRAFSDFVSPITNPLFFEDPRTLSEIRPIFAQHWIPNSNPAFSGGDAQYFAVQARVALTERLSFIANKDGYIWMNSDNPAVIPDDEGWADIAAGLKYNVIRNPSLPLIASVGGTFEVPCGSGGVFQGSGDGEFHLFGTAGAGLTDRSHWLSATGFRLPTNTSQRSQMWYWSNHVDYEVIDTWYGLVELNWFHWMQSGDRLPLSFEGGDLFNLGSTGVAGNDIVTLGLGGKKRFGEMNEIGLAYEIPLTERKDVLQSRLYLDLIIRY